MIFSVIFCSYLWHLVQWFDNYLIQALYPALGGVPGMGILENITTLAGTTNQMFVDMVIGTLYVVLPILWITVMGWVGFQAGGFISGVLNAMNAPANAAAERSGNSVRKLLP